MITNNQEVKFVWVDTYAHYQDISSKSDNTLYFVNDIKKIYLAGTAYGVNDAELGAYLPKAGGTMDGGINMNGKSITSVGGLRVNFIYGYDTGDDILIGSHMGMSSHRIKNMANGTDINDAVNLSQLNGRVLKDGDTMSGTLTTPKIVTSEVVSPLVSNLSLSGGSSNRGGILLSGGGVSFFYDEDELALIDETGMFFSGALGSNSIYGLRSPVDPTEATNKTYVDGLITTNITNKLAVANGIATLDDSGTVPAGQLPSYVDDVLEFTNYAGFPASGEASKIYVAKDTNIIYRWSGSAYIEISSSLALGETSSTAYRGDRGKAAYDHITETDNPHAVTKAQVGLGSVINYGLATEAEAKAGTSSAKYMTPLRVAQAIAELATKTVWNVVTS